MREFAEIEGMVRRSEVARSGGVPGSGAARHAGVGGGVRRRASGPRPVRPVASSVAVRPVQPARPACRATPVRVVVPLRPAEGERLLERATPVARPAVAERLRRVLAGVAAFAVAAAVVVGLGLLAGHAGGSRSSGPGPVPAPGPVGVTVEQAGTVWDVARRVEPAAEGAQLSALVERIVTDNGLSSVRVVPGQVLRVPAG